MSGLLLQTLFTVVGLVIAVFAAVNFEEWESAQPHVVSNMPLQVAQNAFSARSLVSPEDTYHLVSSQEEGEAVMRWEDAEAARRFASHGDDQLRSARLMMMSTLSEEEAAYRLIADLQRDATGAKIVVIDWRGQVQ